MTSVDLAVLGVMFLSGLVALMRGLVREVLSVAAWLGAAAVATTFMPLARPMVSQWVPSPEWTDPAGYIILFLVSLILFTLIAKLIGGAVRSSAIGGVDRSLGFLFGLARGAAIAVAAYIIAGMAIPVDHWPAQVLEARSLPYVYDGAKLAVRLIPPEYQPPVQAPPPARQTGMGGVISATPAGRASDRPSPR